MMSISSMLTEFSRYKEALQETAGSQGQSTLYVIMTRGVSGDGCPVCDGFKGTMMVSYLRDVEAALDLISEGLNARHVVDMERVAVVGAEVVAREPVEVLYERTGRHTFSSIKVTKLGYEYHDLGNGTKGWTELT